MINKNLALFLFLGTTILLGTTVSAVPSISLTAPNITYNYTQIGQSLSINFTVTDPSIGSCWYNYNGTNNSVNCYSGGDTATATGHTTTETITTARGVRINITEDGYALTISPVPTCTAGRVMLQDASYDNISIQSVVGGVATFNQNITKGTYHLNFDNSGSNYQNNYTLTPSYPYTSSGGGI